MTDPTEEPLDDAQSTEAIENDAASDETDLVIQSVTHSMEVSYG